MQASNGDQHLANRSLIEELVLKLPMSKILEWARVAINIKPYPTILNFCEWISELGNLINIVQDLEKEPKRRVLLNNAESQAQQPQPKCLFCEGKHRLTDCSKTFMNLSETNYQIAMKFWN